MIGIHIYPINITYRSNHSDITQSIGETKVTVSYHKNYEKQVFYETDEYFVFVDGWIFNSPNYKTQAQYVLEQFLLNKVDFIYNINGQFNLVIVDRRTKEIEYYSDIFSIRKHYYTINENFVFLSSDLVFLRTYLNNPSLNIAHIKSNLNSPRFIDIEQTFINEIKQGFPCMKISNNIISRYSIEEVKTRFLKEESQPVSFLKKIKKKIKSNYRNETMLLLLTGGLDSRFLLEIFNELNITTKAATYGNIHSDEVKIAKEVAESNSTEHLIFNLNSEDFLLNAKPYMQRVSGMDIFVQSTIYEFLKYIKSRTSSNEILETGFALDMFLGGSQLNKEKSHDSSIESRVFSALSIRQSALREYFEDRYFMYDYEIYFMMTSLPKTTIKDNSFYYELCKLQIKNSFHIPLQSTMMNLAVNPSYWKTLESIQKEKENFTLKYYRQNRQIIYHNRYYSDFGMWIRDDNGWKKFITELFLDKESNLSKKFLAQQQIEETLTEHFEGTRDHIRDIVKWVSIELFLEDMIN